MRREQNEIFERSASEPDNLIEFGTADRDVFEFKKSHDGIFGGYTVSCTDCSELRLLCRYGGAFVCKVEKGQFSPINRQIILGKYVE